MPHLLARQGKQFTHVEIIKSCLMIAAAKEVCPQKINVSKTISLLARIVAQRIEEQHQWLIIKPGK